MHQRNEYNTIDPGTNETQISQIDNLFSFRKTEIQSPEYD
jgi:hypothetical protein